MSSRAVVKMREAYALVIKMRGAYALLVREAKRLRRDRVEHSQRRAHPRYGGPGSGSAQMRAGVAELRRSGSRRRSCETLGPRPPLPNGRLKRRRLVRRRDLRASLRDLQGAKASTDLARGESRVRDFPTTTEWGEACRQASIP